MLAAAMVSSRHTRHEVLGWVLDTVRTSISLPQTKLSKRPSLSRSSVRNTVSAPISLPQTKPAQLRELVAKCRA